MKSNKLMVVAAVSVVLVSSICIARIMSLEVDFDQESAKMKLETGTYDFDFTKMVDRMEVELEDRASFPYLGGKDPMTGKTRIMVANVQTPKNGRKYGLKPSAKVNAPQAQPSQPVIEQVAQAHVQSVALEPEPPAVVQDPVRLTAIIYDDFKKAYTAIMMVGERSFSVEVGDRLHGRVTREISVQKVTLEDADRTYQYDISGNISNRAK